VSGGKVGRWETTPPFGHPSSIRRGVGRLDTAYRILHTAYWILDTGCWILDEQGVTSLEWQKLKTYNTTIT